MNQHNNGGPAFPNTGMHHSDKGMSLRDYFAAKALASIATMGHDELEEMSGHYEEATTIDLLAITAYQMADAMLRAREGV